MSEIELSEQELNEQCFLINKENVDYVGIVIYDIFNKKDDLKKGIDKLFEFLGKKEDYPNWKDSINFINDHNIIDAKIKLVLDIYNTKSLKKRKFPTFNFGVNIDHISLSLIAISHSIYSLEIRAYLNKNATKSLNQIIYTNHSSETRQFEYYGKYGNFLLDPIQLKSYDIDLLKKNIKKDVINFLSNFFNGYFINSKQESIDLIPNVDIFSFSFPPNEEEKNVEGIQFLKCFNFLNQECFVNEHFLLYEENYKFPTYLNKNYVLFIDKNIKIESDNYKDLKDYLQFLIDRRMSFYIIGLNKLFKSQEKILSNISSYLSNEIDLLRENDLDTLIESRNSLFKEFFTFEKFKSEIVDSNSIFIEGIEGDLINQNEINFVKFIKDEINFKSNVIQRQISLFKFYADNNLKIKNIEFNKQNAEYTKNNNICILILTVAVAVMTVVQIIVQIYKSP